MEDNKPQHHGGYKRKKLIQKYPNLCQFYEDHVYGNKDIAKHFEKIIKSSAELHQVADMIIGLQGVNESDWRRFAGSLLEYGRDNLVKIDAYISKPFATEYTTDIVISHITLLSNMGGLMGLCMGFSVVSLAEIVHCVSVLIITKYRKGLSIMR